MNFSEISKMLRKSRNLTQEALAKELQTSKSCISMIEIGKNEPTANTLLRYADYFQCSTDFLLGREDDFGNTTTAPLLLEAVTTEEQLLLRRYRKLNANNQSYVKAYLDIRLEEQGD